MMPFRFALKFILFVVLVLGYVMTSFFWRIAVRNFQRRRYLYTRTVSFYCRSALRVLGFRIRVLGGMESRKTSLLVGNHLGFLDIFVLSSQHPSLFVTSVEMRKTPGLGLMTELGGCLYVDRKKRTGIATEVHQLREALHQGFTVTLYPEGTSSNGEKVLPFKPSLLAAAIGTGIPIVPVVINYRQVNGEPLSDKWRDYVFWYGDLTFAPALFRILSLKSVDVDLEFCAPLDTSTEIHRRELAAHLQTVIESKYTKIPKKSVDQSSASL